MAKMFNIIGIILSISGLIAGIVYGVSTKNFAISLYIWIGTFLYCIIYFGIARILNNQDDIMSNSYRYYSDLMEKMQASSKNQNTQNNTAQPYSVKESASKIPVKHLVRCPRCNKMVEKFPCIYCTYDN